ncbi:hypothetical protein C8J57DRAFT_1323643 [Mycena rebaudengoi]|nr:hypothetical protein C8J57DRAFT_1323643 [Mycena rebaudengoi]
MLYFFQFRLSRLSVSVREEEDVKYSPIPRRKHEKTRSLLFSSNFLRVETHSTVFPQELIDAIIGELSQTTEPLSQETQTTLKSCALVARSFVSSSQRGLFTTVKIEPQSVRQFFALGSSSPHVTLLVKHLSLRGPIPIEYAASVLALLPNLGAVTIDRSDYGIYFYSPSVNVAGSGPRMLPAKTTLHTLVITASTAHLLPDYLFLLGRILRIAVTTG